jgi:hypothetical protein
MGRSLDATAASGALTVQAVVGDWFSVTLGSREGTNFHVGFTRGYMSSQAYAREFKSADFRPDEKDGYLFDSGPYEAQWAWLGYHARPTSWFEFNDKAELPEFGVSIAPHRDGEFALAAAAKAVERAKQNVIFALMSPGGGSLIADLKKLASNAAVFEFGVLQTESFAQQLIFDREIATLYAIEGIRLADHYRFRDRLKSGTDKKPVTLPGPGITPPWYADFYTAGTAKYRSRTTLIQ